MEKRILVTGSQGQLGKSLQDAVRDQNTNKPLSQFFFTDIDELDITKKEDIRFYVEQQQINIIINAAAYTAVDKAENEIEAAFSINEHAVRNLACVAQENDIYLIHISTDYVFDGEADNPYTTFSSTNPVTQYGKSKRAGEQAILELAGKSVIVRTSWLYSEYGHNFVKTMMRLGKMEKAVRVVADQYGSPTYALDLATVLLMLSDKITMLSLPKVYHYSNEGVTTWYDFAKTIMNYGKIDCKVIPITTKDYPTPAKRPHYSALSLSEIQNDLNISVIPWEESLERMIIKNRAESLAGQVVVK